MGGIELGAVLSAVLPVTLAVIRGLRWLYRTVEQRGYDRAMRDEERKRADKYREESLATIAEKDRELAALHAQIDALRQPPTVSSGGSPA